MIRNYLVAFVCAVVSQGIFTYIPTKLSVLGSENITKYIIFVAVTAYKKNILFINPPIFAILYILIKYPWGGAISVKEISGIIIFFIFTYSVCWIVFIYSVFAAGAR